MKLRVWWIRNVPNKAEYYPINSIKEAIKKLDELAKKDLKNKSVSSNAGGLEEFDEKDNKWYEYYDDEGRDITEIRNKE